MKWKFSTIGKQLLWVNPIKQCLPMPSNAALDRSLDFGGGGQYHPSVINDRAVQQFG